MPRSRPMSTTAPPRSDMGASLSRRSRAEAWPGPWRGWAQGSVPIDAWRVLDAGHGSEHPDPEAGHKRQYGEPDQDVEKARAHDRFRPASMRTATATRAGAIRFR